jgi:drug/metabolite transporter (DMT)-like permease
VPAPAIAPRGFGPRETVLLLTLASMWGLSFLFIEIALRGLGPMWIVVGRTGVGALVLLTVLRLRGRRLPASARLWGQVLILGVVTNAVPWSAVAWAQQSLPSGLVALLMAAVPTSTLLVSVAIGLERFTPARIAGLALALSGVALTVAGDATDPGRLVAIGVIVVATIMYASGAVYANQRVSGNASALTIATGQVITAFLVTVPVALLLDPLPDPQALTPAVLAAVTALGALGTGAAFLVFYTLIERVGATNTTLVTYLIPLVAVVAGAVVLGERLGVAALAGGLLIVGGVWLAQRGTRATGELDPESGIETVADAHAPATPWDEPAPHEDDDASAAEPAPHAGGRRPHQ